MRAFECYKEHLEKLPDATDVIEALNIEKSKLFAAANRSTDQFDFDKRSYYRYDRKMRMKRKTERKTERKENDNNNGLIKEEAATE
ncbi:hypothetical protein B2D07_18920 [Desulfococcus multivorans]|nr:uncharacterized protein Dmul_37810 [Desulfococcus multivorans]AQV02644.1 hypothetical protein B2D07_18920 [Desulfococcus multivorans]